MSSATWITGDTLQVVRRMPDDSVDLVLTSPPFLALRSYLPDDDPAKAHEIGQEATPGEFLDALLDLTEEWRRVLAPHGSICVELGDTYSGSGGHGGDYEEGGLRDGQPKFAGAGRAQRGTTGPRSQAIAERRSSRPKLRKDVPRSKYGDPAVQPDRFHWRGERDGWPTDKSLTLIPELYRMALAYGINPLTGRETPRWRIRNVIRWVRPNPPVGALGDKFRPGTSEMVIATGTDEAGRTRYFDLDAVRHEPQHGYASTRAPLTTRPVPGQPQRKTNPMNDEGERIECNPAGAPPLDWWEIPTAPYKGSHYATFPPALCERPIKAMCPTRVCITCGEPSRRIVETHPTGQNLKKPGHPADASKQLGAVASTHVPSNTVSNTVGWTDCGHDTWRTGIVLDPFGGSGTTLAVATGHGRDAIGIDLDTRNVELARERIGPMLFTEATVDELWPQDGAA